MDGKGRIRERDGRKGENKGEGTGWDKRGKGKEGDGRGDEGR